MAQTIELATREGPGVSTVPTVAVVGFPNVGKSIMVNRLTVGRGAWSRIPRRGLTRDRKQSSCEWNGVKFELLDTGGIKLLANEDELAR